MKTIIVEDENLAYEDFTKLLKKNAPHLNIIARAENVNQAVYKISRTKPDLVFMDIDLPDGTGFDIIEKLKPVDFALIFVTAYNQYAVQAFRFSAIDFLMKPVCEEDLLDALEKAAQHEKQKNLNVRLDALFANLQAQSGEGKKLVLRTMEDIFIVGVKEIVCIESDGAYSRFVLLSGKKVIVSTNLKKQEETLQGHGFFRCHQGYLVNLLHVERFHKLDGGTLIMKNGINVPVASRKKDELLEVLSQM